ncbi:MAG: hypothetical protein RLZZ511_2342 [Cyanobacteriota bacterium]|jgi:hypothetical protein
MRGSLTHRLLQANLVPSLIRMPWADGGAAMKSTQIPVPRGFVDLHKFFKLLKNKNTVALTRGIFGGVHGEVAYLQRNRKYWD